jgi:outer membrane protein TolC
MNTTPVKYLSFRREALALLLVSLLATASTLSNPAAAGERLTLSQAVDLALKESPNLGAASARSSEAVADYEIAAAGLLPRVAANASVNRLNEDRLGLGGTSSSALYTRDSFGGVTGRQLLFDGGKTAASKSAAQRGVEAGRMGFQATREETVYRVSQAFSRALDARDSVRVAASALDRQKGFEALAVGYFEAGKTIRLDALKAEAARLDAERVLANAREAETMALVALAQAIGLRSVQPISIEGELPASFEEAPPDDEVIEAVTVNNPDIQQARAQVAQAEESLRSAQAARNPELALVGGYGYRDRDIGGSALEWTLGLAAAWTLYDGGALPAQSEKARARLNQAREALRTLELGAQTQLKDALRAWRTALNDARASAKLVEANKESLKAADVLYRAGKATALDVLTAQADLAAIEGARVRASADYAVARYAMARLVGNPSESESKP